MTKKLSKFVVGDLVKLKSGGPTMTVNNANELRGYYECKWFEKNDVLKKENFKEDALEKSDTNEPL